MPDDFTSRLDPQMALAMEKSATLAPGLDGLEDLSIEEIRRRYRQERQFWNEDRAGAAARRR